MKIVAEIPARYGSKRVKLKNLRLLDNKPLIYYAINAAKEAKTISEVYVNTESDLIGKVGIDNGVNYYKRNPGLAEDGISSDEFNYDFMKHVPSDIVVMVNPVAPLITGRDIDDMVNYFLRSNLDTLIPIREENMHAFCADKNGIIQPVNFQVNGRLAMTQKNVPIKICAWTVCIWKTKNFIEHFEKKGYAVFSGKLGFYPQPKLKAVKISTEEDFILAEILLRNQGRQHIQVS